MHERAWEGVIVAAVFFAGMFTGHWYPGVGKTTTLKQEASGETKASSASVAIGDTRIVAANDDTGTERIESKVVKPDGTVATTSTTRDFHWRRMAQEDQHEEKKVEIQYIDRWQTKTDLKIVERLREPRWAIAALGGFSLDAKAPVLAVQMEGRMMGPFSLVLQVQRTFAGGPLDGWLALAGVKVTW